MVPKISPESVEKRSEEETSYVEKKIPFMRGRPEREGNINSDDILNLIIAINTCSTLEELFDKT
ncbi:MAG: hypothetical protein N2053_06470 [Chitinispirillaceae bacterium]|nr:hypothetical protein [Chitinispirillaceae bacterium]